MRIRRADFDEDCLALLKQGEIHDSDLTPWAQHETWQVHDGLDLVAVATVRADTTDPTGVFLSSCFVAPSHRGHGLQKRLIRARLRYAKKAGYVWAWSYTAIISVASMRSLVDCGFKPSRRRAVPGFLCWEKPLCSTP